MKTSLLFIGSILFSLLLYSCSSSSETQVKTPVDDLIRDMDKEKTFSIVLYDMDLEENTLGSDVHKHRYKIIKEKDSIPYDSLTDWIIVEDWVFEMYAHDMGMEIASKGEDGKVVKEASPPGFNNYVGNSRYGSWQTDSHGTSFWQFYGQYMFMNSMLNLMSPIHRTPYNDYHTNYRGRSSYYGNNSSNGKPMYGTFGTNNASSKSPSYTSKSSSFQSKVNSMASRSGGQGASKSAFASKVSASKSRSTGQTTRSTSRYSGSSSSTKSRSTSRGGK